MIRLEAVSKSYPGEEGRPVAILDGVTFQVAKGDVVAVTGPSGCGKTTLLNILGALDEDYGGSVTIDGREIRSMGDGELSRFRAATVGFVFQQFNLFPRETALANVLTPGWFLPSMDGDEERKRRGRELLERVGLKGKEGHLPARLSGGERQRVAIARALFNRPKILLCDEPTGNLDQANSEAIVQLFHDLAKSDGLTVVIVTHDAKVAASARRILNLHGGKISESEPASQGTAQGTA